MIERLTSLVPRETFVKTAEGTRLTEPIDSNGVRWFGPHLQHDSFRVDVARERNYSRLPTQSPSAAAFRMVVVLIDGMKGLTDTDIW